MKVKIFTLPFDEGMESFPEGALDGFCARNKVKHIHTQFFKKGEQLFWTVAVQYEPLIEGTEISTADLSEQEQRLYEQLANWRWQLAQKEGFPSYVICRNVQLVDLVRQRCTTLDAVRRVKGFGKIKTEKYGKAIIKIIKDFYGKEENQ